MKKNLEEIKELLKKYNQEHLLNFYDNMEESKQNKLLEQIENIDFDALMKMIDYGVVGKLVEVESADGDHVEIYVE